MSKTKIAYYICQGANAPSASHKDHPFLDIRGDHKCPDCGRVGKFGWWVK